MCVLHHRENWDMSIYIMYRSAGPEGRRRKALNTHTCTCTLSLYSLILASNEALDVCVLLVTWSLTAGELMCTWVHLWMCHLCLNVCLWIDIGLCRSAHVHSSCSVCTCLCRSTICTSVCGCGSVLEAESCPVFIQVCVSGLKGDSADVCVWLCVAVTDLLTVTPPCPQICA